MRLRNATLAIFLLSFGTISLAGEVGIGHDAGAGLTTDETTTSETCDTLWCEFIDMVDTEFDTDASDE